MVRAPPSRPDHLPEAPSHRLGLPRALGFPPKSRSTCTRSAHLGKWHNRIPRGKRHASLSPRGPSRRPDSTAGIPLVSFRLLRPCHRIVHAGGPCGKEGGSLTADLGRLACTWPGPGRLGHVVAPTTLSPCSPLPGRTQHVPGALLLPQARPFSTFWAQLRSS